MPKKSKPVEPEPVEVEEALEEEQVTCPVCGKPVGLDVATCPNCGAEFEEEEVETQEEQPEEASPKRGPAVPAASPEEEAEPVSEEEIAECPVCGKSVALSLSSCPNCGAEFEEEAVEEVIEVEEKEAPAEEIEVEEQEEASAEEDESPIAHPTSVLDLRVLGVSFIILGIIGLQIAAFINWYWTWVPPIKSNLGMFIGVAAVVIVVGLLIYMLAERRIDSGKEVPAMMPNLMLSLFLFGIMALVLIMFWSPINSALQHSSLGVAGAFLGILIVGILAMIMGQRMAEKNASAAGRGS